MAILERRDARFPGSTRHRKTSNDTLLGIDLDEWRRSEPQSATVSTPTAAKIEGVSMPRTHELSFLDHAIAERAQEMRTFR